MADRKPAPELVAEMETLLARLRPMSDLTACGKGETLTITLTVPAENVDLAAWLMTKRVMQAGHGLAGDHSHVTLTAGTAGDDHDLDRARQYFEGALLDTVAGDWSRLERGDHPLLLPPRTFINPYGLEAIDDDIPF